MDGPSPGFESGSTSSSGCPRDVILSEKNRRSGSPPGPHSVSTTWRFSVTLAFQKGESYYFVISENWVEMSGMEIEQWPADRAQQLMAKYRRLEVE